jgi:hypothetical protein
MEYLEKLVAIEDLKAMKAQYLRYIDGKEWDKFEALFIPEASFDAPELGGQTVVGIKKWRKFTEDFLAEAVSIHHVYAPEITITSPTSAHGIWIMDDTLIWEKGESPNGFREIRGWGSYYETYVKISGVWLMSSWKLKRVKLERTK